MVPLCGGRGGTCPLSPLPESAYDWGVKLGLELPFKLQHKKIVIEYLRSDRYTVPALQGIPHFRSIFDLMEWWKYLHIHVQAVIYTIVHARNTTSAFKNLLMLL